MWAGPGGSWYTIVHSVLSYPGTRSKRIVVSFFFCVTAGGGGERAGMGGVGGGGQA